MAATSRLARFGTHLSALVSLLLLSGASYALPITVLHSFAGTVDGGLPTGALALGKDGNLYGTTSSGGPNGCSCGTFFKMTPAGVRTVLHAFSGPDGSRPLGAIIQARDGNFYGTTNLGGANDSGTIFRITPSGVFTSLHSFAAVVNYSNADGANPTAGLVQGADGNFYGTALVGGIGGGTVYRMTPAGAVTVLHSFLYGEGELPKGGVVFGSDGDLYGTTIFYGQDAQHPDGGYGSVFKLSPTTTQFTVLHIFNGLEGGYANQLVLGADGNFYGTSVYNGANNSGVVFKISPAGAYTTLYSFGGGIDGSAPEDALVQGIDGNFYGTTQFGGSQGGGTIFRITPNGTLMTLHDLGASGEGYWPYATLARGADGSFYGATQYGGTSDQGTVFKIAGPLSAPAWVSPPTPNDNAIFNLTITRPFSVALRASSAASLETVHIAATGKPAGAGVSSFDGNPGNATMQWTPVSGQAGDYTVTFTANNVSAPVVTPPKRTLKLHVVKRGTSISAKPVIVETSQLLVHLHMIAVLTATDPSAALAGKAVRFEGSDGSLLCSVTTDATGTASCTGIAKTVSAIVNRGYTARFAGDGAYAASSAFGYLINN
jgi:uncharacterized repeat protein (TIGR03803 family)